MSASRILIIDDHPIYREGLARSLGEQPDLAVCGEGATAEEAVTLSAALRPDLVLLDLSMPGGGLVALERILAANSETDVVVLTASEEDDDVFRALELGAKGYVAKGVGANDLASILRSVLDGESYVSPQLAARLLRRLGTSGIAQVPSPAGGEALSSLTKREEQILQLVAKGNSNKEIARLVDAQEKTIKNHMTRIMQKLNARSRLEAALILRDAGDGT
ncbi:MAG: response regulator transcription factor [Mesorhizobium sp.]|nr:response regulator transcription factor [Mesorhizobium sp.]MBL8576592.1 response regulator transcription factor [Mesorhizobium sp.]